MSSCKFIDSKPLAHTVYWEKACNIDETLRLFDWPDRSPDSEKVSFRLQCDKHIVERYRPTEYELCVSDQRVLPTYIKHSLPSYLVDLDSVSEVIDEFKGYIKGDSTPGVPYAITANRNDKLFEILGSRFNDLVIERMSRRLYYSLDDIRKMSRRELVENNLMDPVRVFVKSEPHKVKKLQEGRVRLIMSVSILDKFIEMLLCRHLYKLEIRNWFAIPSKPGIGFTDEDVELVYDDVMSSLPMSATDISGWDWSVDYWQILDEAEGVIKLCTNSREWWEHLLRATAIIECKSIYQFSDGTLVVPTFDGLVNSGKFKTSRGNSFMRKRLSDLVGARKCIAAGDDTVESTVKLAVEKYRRFGFEIKEYVDVIDEFEFCSRVYKHGQSWPVNYQKIVMNLLHNIPKTPLEFRMYMTGFIDDLEHHPKFEDILNLVEQVGYFELAGAQDIVGDN